MITVGETYDVEFSSETTQDLLLDLLLPRQKTHTTQTLSFTPGLPQGPAGRGPSVSFARSGITVAWDPKFGNLLGLAEACDVPVRWSCRTGVCHTCVTGLISGSISYAPSHSRGPLRGICLCAARSQAQMSLLIFDRNLPGQKSAWGKRAFVEGRLLSHFKFAKTYVIERDGVIRRKFIGATDWTNPEIVAYLNKLYCGTQSEIGEDLLHEKSCNRNVQSQVVGREALQRLAKAHPRQSSRRCPEWHRPQSGVRFPPLESPLSPPAGEMTSNHP